MGSGAQVRPGTILEEGAEMAHTVGLKQTIFFPFVVGGSLINFCDALMSGGKSRKVHSEIGSSFMSQASITCGCRSVSSSSST